MKWLAVVALVALFMSPTASEEEEKPRRGYGYFLPPTILEITKEQFLELHVGNPGEKMLFRIDYNSDDLSMYTNTKSSSITWSPYKEIFYFRTHKLRLWVNFSTTPTNDPSTVVSAVPHQGIIGMGPNSQIWNYWGSVVMSNRVLGLGVNDARAMALAPYDGHMIDATLPRSITNQMPRMDPRHEELWFKCWVDGQEYLVHIDPSSEVSYLPRKLYEIDQFDIKVGDGKRALISVTAEDYTFATPSGGSYRTAHPYIGKEENRIILGRSFSNRLVISFNRITGHFSVCVSYDRFPTFSGQETNVWVALVLVAIWLVWLTRSRSEGAGDYDNSFVLCLLRIAGSVVTLFILLYNWKGIDGARHVSQIMRRHANWVFYTIAIFAGVLMVVDVANAIVQLYYVFVEKIGIDKQRAKKKNPKRIGADMNIGLMTASLMPRLPNMVKERRVASDSVGEFDARWRPSIVIYDLQFESMMSIALFLCFSETVLQDGYLYLILITTYIADRWGIAFVFMAACIGDRDIKRVFAMVISWVFFLFFGVFCLAGVIEPCFRVKWYGHSYRWSLTVLWAAVAICAVSVYFGSHWCDAQLHFPIAERVAKIVQTSLKKDHKIERPKK